MTNNVIFDHSIWMSFDPSIMPSTGTPEPGWVFYGIETLVILKKILQRKNVVGFDIVELCPNEKEKSSDFLAAKLYYKMLSYKFLDISETDYDNIDGYKKPTNKNSKFEDEDNDY